MKGHPIEHNQQNKTASYNRIISRRWSLVEFRHMTNIEASETFIVIYINHNSILFIKTAVSL